MKRDALLAAAFAAVVQIELWTTAPRAGSALAALSVLTLAFARRHPLLPICALTAAHIADAAAAGSLSGLATPFAAVVAACLIAGLQARSSLGAAGAGGLAIVAMTVANQLAPDQDYSALDDLVFFALLLGLPTVLGRLLRLRAGLIAELARRAAALREAQEAEAAAAVAEERAALAIGVHDALAHRIGEIAMQAAGAQRLAATEPARALNSLASIEATARAALDDIRDVIGVLRRDDGDLGLAPPHTPAAVVPEPWHRLQRADVAMPKAVRRVTKADVAIAAAVFVALAVETLTSSRLEGPAVANVAGVAATAAPLAFRRRAPLLSAIAVLAAANLQGILLTPPTMLVTAIVLLLLPAYSIAAYLPLRPALAGLLVCLLGTAAIESPGPAAIGIVAWIAGRAVRDRALRVAELRDVNRRLELSKDAHAARARGEERLRIARELHDAVAHSMSVVVLQAEAAQRLWTDRPALARTASEAVGEVARETLGELRSRLRLQDSARRDLEALIARMRPLGLDIEVGSSPPPLPPEIDHVVFSVLQEALTNAARHAAPTSVHVGVRHEPDGVRIEVADTGRAGAPRARIAGTGTGLRGMAERVSACGGELRYGPHGRGFRIEARLPLHA